MHAGHDAQVAASIAGARMVIMNGIGHFPMIENYPLFRSTCLPKLDVHAFGLRATDRALAERTPNHEYDEVNSRESQMIPAN